VKIIDDWRKKQVISLKEKIWWGVGAVLISLYLHSIKSLAI